jgi:hypothetical protein
MCETKEYFFREKPIFIFHQTSQPIIGLRFSFKSHSQSSGHSIIRSLQFSYSGQYSLIVVKHKMCKPRVAVQRLVSITNEFIRFFHVT